MVAESGMTADRPPHMNLKKMIIYLTSTALIVLTVLYFFPTYSSTAKKYHLSEKQLSELKRQAVMERNGEATYRVYQYYAMSNREVPSMILWLRHAATLGNESATKFYQSLKPYIEEDTAIVPSPTVSSP